MFECSLTIYDASIKGICKSSWSGWCKQSCSSVFFLSFLAFFCFVHTLLSSPGSRSRPAPLPRLPSANPIRPKMWTTQGGRFKARAYDTLFSLSLRLSGGHVFTSHYLKIINLGYAPEQITFRYRYYIYSLKLLLVKLNIITMEWAHTHSHPQTSTLLHWTHTHFQQHVLITDTLTHRCAQISLVFLIKFLTPHACMNTKLSGRNTPTIVPVIVINALCCLSPALILCYYISMVLWGM